MHRRSLSSDALRRLLSRAGLVAISRLAGAGATFTAQLLLARWLGPDEFGVYVLLFAVCTVAALICGVGLPSAASRFVAEYESSGRSGLTAAFIAFSRRVTLVGAAFAALIGTVCWHLLLLGFTKKRLGFAPVAFRWPTQPSKDPWSF